MRINAHRTLRISLAAAAVLLLFAECCIAATYVVRKGDTLSAIAKRFSTTVTTLQKTNGLRSPDRVYAGQTISIPEPAKAMEQPSAPVTYGIAKDELELEADEKLLCLLPKDSKFEVLAREGERFNVKLDDGRTGWVSAENVELQETRKPLPVSDTYSMRSDVVRVALAYRGARYRRGGMSSRGFDCSGFVKYVYATKGIKLPHDSRALYNCGKPVGKSDLQEGDLVFFKNTYRWGISHVGLYIGQGKFIHASTSRGGVRVDHLDADYYRRRYAGARRL